MMSEAFCAPMKSKHRVSRWCQHLVGLEWTGFQSFPAPEAGKLVGFNETVVVL